MHRLMQRKAETCGCHVYFRFSLSLCLRVLSLVYSAIFGEESDREREMSVRVCVAHVFSANFLCLPLLLCSVPMASLLQYHRRQRRKSDREREREREQASE